jgi:hypothetical protein
MSNITDAAKTLDHRAREEAVEQLKFPEQLTRVLDSSPASIG